MSGHILHYTQTQSHNSPYSFIYINNTESYTHTCNHKLTIESVYHTVNNTAEVEGPGNIMYIQSTASTKPPIHPDLVKTHSGSHYEIQMQAC